MEKENKEIPFGSKDSKLYKFGYTIPEGYEARIEGNKVIVTKKESEDERIRKGLLEIFNKAQFGEWGKLKIKDIIAYLEKQEEQKPNIELIQRSWYMEGYHDREFGKEPKWIIKTGEGGPKYEENPKYGQMLEAEQKPAEWSEEDDLMRDAILKTLERVGDYGTIGMQKDWLKSIRPQPKQKSHLGMKDQWCCSAAWAAVRDSDAYKGEEKQFILNFLQRCEQQPHWKPSEKQMRCLLDCVSKAKEIHNSSVGGYDAYRILVSLYDELHKLL